MRYLIPVLFLITAALAFSACGSRDNHSVNEHVGGEAAGTTLTLNDGKKWQADQHTRDAIAGIGRVLAEEATVSTEDLNAIGRDLETRVQGLVQGCTMTGAEHEQLHVFLNQFIPAVEHLANETDATKAKEAHKSVLHLVEEYDRHFQ